MTTTAPTRQGGGLRRPPMPLIIAGILVIAVIVSLVARFTLTRPADPLAGATLAPVARGDLSLDVSATGQVEPRVQADLAFSGAAGIVREVLVSEGQSVAASAPLLTLDSRQQQAEVTAAEANLAVANADLQALREGATPEQLAEAQAQVSAARGALTQTQGSVTQADLRAARAGVDEARARLTQLEAGPKSDARARAETALTDARAELDRQRSALATAKEDARVGVEQQANAVRDAQSAYSSAYWDLEHVKSAGTDPRSGRSLNDFQKQDFVNAFDQASRTLADAEAALRQAQVDYENTKQNELSGLASAEARVQSAQSDLDVLLQGADTDDLAAARAQLARAEAEVTRLSSAERSGAIAAQQGNLAAAQARLDQLGADPKASDLARAEARVAQAQAQLDEARVRLEDTTLRAPFAGVVAAVNVAPGEAIGAQLSPVVLIDTSRYLVKVTVDEVDIARISLGQPVQVLIDALGAPTLAGTVQRIEPLPQGESAVTAYRISVELDPGQRDLKPGMTASASIVADQRSDVLSVPAAALRRDGERTLISVVTLDADEQKRIEEREVQVGLRAGGRAEILSGLREGDQVVVELAQ